MEELLGLDADRRGAAEIEFVAPIEIGHEVELLVGEGSATGWLAEPGEAMAVRTALRFTPSSTI